MRALFIAQIQDMVRNPMLLVFWSILIPLGFVMKMVMPDSAFSLLGIMLLIMSAYFVGWNTPAHTMAEEKEKRLLEALFLTPIRPWHVVLVKGSLGLLFSLLFGTLMVLILGRPPANLPLLALSYLVLTLFTVAGGTLMGLLVKDMKTLGAAGSPVLLVLIFATVLPWEQFRPEIWQVQAFLPTRPVVELLQAGYLGEEAPLLRSFLVMLAWTGAIVAVCTRLIRRLAFAPR